MTSHTPVGVPAGWRRLPDDDPHVVVSAASHRTPTGCLPAQLVLRLEAAGVDPLAETARPPERLDVEDEDVYDLEGHQVHYRRFSRYGGAEAITDHWWWSAVADSETGVSLSCSVAREHYADYCELFEAISLTVRPEVLPLSPPAA